MGKAVIDRSNVVSLRPPRADRKNPERDSAVRYRAIPASHILFQNKDTVLVPKWALYAGKGMDQEVLNLIYSLSERVSALEKQIAVENGYASPAEPESPMDPVPVERESEATLATSVPGNEAEDLTVSDVSPHQAEVVEIAGLLPAPPVEAANDEDVQPPIEGVTTEQADEYMLGFMRRQFNWSDMEIWNILQGEFRKRDAHCKKKHKGKSYDDVRLERQFKRLGLEGPGMVCYPAKEPLKEKSGFSKWCSDTLSLATLDPRLVAERGIRRADAANERRAYWRGMAFTPEAYRKRKERANRKVKLAKLKYIDKIQDILRSNFRHMDQTAHAVTVRLPRTSASQLRAWGLMLRDGTDRVRRVLGLTIPDRGKKHRDLDAALVYPKGCDTTVQDALELTHDLAQLPMREVVRRYNQAGISH